MKRKFIVTIFLLIITSVFCQNNLKTGWNDNLMIEHDGVQRYFRVYVPKASTKKMKAVVQLHQESKSMRVIYKKKEKSTRSWQKLADKGKFVLIVPNGMNSITNDAKGDSQFWNDCGDTNKFVYGYSKADDVGFISKVVDFCIKNGNVDKKRIYVTGIANGGMMAMRLAIETNKFAAIACFFTNLPEVSECTDKPRKTPVFLMNATKDSIVPFYGGLTQWDSIQVMSSQRTIEYWFMANGYFGHNPNKLRTNNTIKKDSCHIIHKRYGVPKSRGHIDYHTIVKGIHHMPTTNNKILFGLLRRRIRVGRNVDVEASDMAWQFLKQFKN